MYSKPSLRRLVKFIFSTIFVFVIFWNLLYITYIVKMMAGGPMNIGRIISTTIWASIVFSIIMYWPDKKKPNNVTKSVRKLKRQVARLKRRCRGYKAELENMHAVPETPRDELPQPDVQGGESNSGIDRTAERS